MNGTILHTKLLETNAEDADVGQRWLVQVHPLNLEQNRIELDRRDTILGRSHECDVVLEDESVSRQHAVIRFGEDGYTIEDLGSTNGVIVNDELLSLRLLRTGDRIQLGKRIFRFLADTDVEAQYHETVYSMMTRDGLTSVFNKRYLLECMDREVVRSQRHQRPLSVILMDIDHFKSINDTHGHLVGDEVLRELAQRLSRLLGDDEILARFGGEEFAIICDESKLESALQLAERCRQEVADSPFSTASGPLDVTISLGVATLGKTPECTRDSLLAEADGYLYESKRAGRNRVTGPAHCADYA
ncbi:MAG: GGDEF domain-containing protein [Planctomycetales bacterium]|nr:GGDEF domain-containing protein [Planctomycetales bacterium]MCA9184687.1 GGDEF domain-containing protein [Planctomycetales bacterium]